MARKFLRNRRSSRQPKPILFDLAKAMGNVAIEWNTLEVVYHELIHLYMVELSQDVAAAVLNAMNSTSKAAFFEFLIAKTETHKGFLDHLSHFQKMIHILTENRNILQHSLPDLRFGYKGVIYKRNKLGKPVPYEASVDDFLQIITDLQTAREYAYELMKLRGAQVASQIGGKRKFPPNVTEMLKAIEKPDLPHKLIPSPLGATPQVG
jgi:hypothetical protein